VIGGGGDVDSMLQFRFKRGGDGTKRCQKVKRRHRAHLGGGTREGK
jgi:hypothetical protein